MDTQTMGDPCPVCGGTEYYCADEVDEMLGMLQVVCEAALSFLNRGYSGVQDKIRAEDDMIRMLEIAIAKAKGEAT